MGFEGQGSSNCNGYNDELAWVVRGYVPKRNKGAAWSRMLAHGRMPRGSRASTYGTGGARTLRGVEHSGLMVGYSGIEAPERQGVQ